MHKTQLTIATRESPLALWQAHWVKSCLEHRYPNLTVTLLGLTTQADRLPYISLAEIGGKGLFVKELEEALLDGRADIAVHCMKDMPVEYPSGLVVPVICERVDPSDAFVSNQYATLAELPPASVVGTSSLRRQSQLMSLRPDLVIKPLRGNVNTRLAKLDAGEYAAIILATAGLKRLGFDKRIRERLSYEAFLPSAGQGALGIECRENDSETRSLIRFLNDEVTSVCVSVERAVCSRLGVGCHVPVAVHAECIDDHLRVHGLVATVDGKHILRADYECNANQSGAAGFAVAESLLAQGAGKILQALAGRHE